MNSPAVRPPLEQRQVPDEIYRNVFWSVPLGLAVVNVSDPHQPRFARILSANPAALRMKDFTLADVIGKTVREVLPGVLDTVHPVNAAEAIRAGRRDAEDRFWKAIQAAPFAICIFQTVGGEIVETNARFRELFGLSADAATVRKRAADLGMWADPSERERIIADLNERREIRETSVMGRRPDGQIFQALAALEVIRYGGEDCILAIFLRI